MDLNIDWYRVRKELDTMEWENEERMIYLSSVFNLMPSGKYYMPWACSNLEPCEACKGAGQRKVTKLDKKQEARADRTRKLAKKRGLFGRAFTQTALGKRHKAPTDTTCRHCEGLGSREALLDQVYWEELERQAGLRGLFITSGEGDPCDIFIGETE